MSSQTLRALLYPDVVLATLGAFQATNTGRFLASLQRAFPQRSVLVTTTHPDTFDFFRVLEMGASDFLLPPLRRSELLPRLMRQTRVIGRGDALVQKLKEDIGLKHIIGESPAFLDKVQCVPRFARCDATVLISGESGTGKEIFARAIHYLSSRAEPTVRSGQLRCASREPGGERDIRSQTRRVHGGRV